MADIENRALSWDSTIENDGPDTLYTVLEPGEYTFSVKEMERVQFAGSDKMPACPQAKLILEVSDNAGNVARVRDSLFLCTRQEWKLCRFFTSIGQRKHGEKLTPNWNKVVNASGRVQVTKEAYTGNDDKEHYSNRVISYLEPINNTPVYGAKKPWQK